VVNLIHGTDCIIQSEEIALAEEVTCWQGGVLYGRHAGEVDESHSLLVTYRPVTSLIHLFPYGTRRRTTSIMRVSEPSGVVVETVSANQGR